MKFKDLFTESDERVAYGNYDSHIRKDIVKHLQKFEKLMDKLGYDISATTDDYSKNGFFLERSSMEKITKANLKTFKEVENKYLKQWEGGIGYYTMGRYRSFSNSIKFNIESNGEIELSSGYSYAEPRKITTKKAFMESIKEIIIEERPKYS